MLRSVLVLLFLCTGSIAHSAMPDIDVSPQAGEVITFDVYRNGDTRFGVHEVRFENDGEDLLAFVDIELRAGLGPITVFRYEHSSSERWRNGEVVAFRSETLKDGETYTVQAERTSLGLQIEGLDPELNPVSATYQADLLPSSHWHGYPAGLEQIFNTEHGTLMDTRVEYLGQSEIEADEGVIMASHYRLSSSLTVDLWYDEHGRWAGCQFEARGQTVRYVRRTNPAIR